MNANDNALRPDLDILELAADWVDQLDELSAADRLELAAWLRASPAHAAAFASVLRMVRDPALLAAADQIRAEAARAPVAVRPAKPRARAWGLIAAGLVALVGGSILTTRLLSTSRAPKPLELATAIGARSDYTLSDASVIHLNAASQASVVYGKTARDIRLHKGDALFEVAKNPARPFNVAAGDATVTAVGTTFEVDMVSDAVEVRVFDGAVRVSRANAEPRMVAKGQWLLLAADHRTSSGRFTPETQGWRSDWLDAQNMPLKYVVARLNRYTPDEVLLHDPGIGELPVTGRFRLDRTNDSLAMISALLAVDAAKRGHRTYLSPRQDDQTRSRPKTPS